MPSSNHPLFLTLLVLGLFISAYTQGITIAPPPAIQERKVFSLKDSPNDGRTIGSTKVESLELTASESGGNTSTLFKIRYFNRQATDNTTSYNFTFPGNWTHVSNSLNSLSCSIVADVANNKVGMVLFDRHAKIFKMLASTSATTFTSTPLNQSSIEGIKLSVFVGEKCLAGNYNNGTYTTVYRLDQNKNELTIIRSI